MCGHKNPEGGPMFQLGTCRKMNDEKVMEFSSHIATIIRCRFLARRP